MFRRTTRPSAFWAAAALLALLLAAPHTLLAQTAPKTVYADVTNYTAKPVEIALVGPDNKDREITLFVPDSKDRGSRSLQPGKNGRARNRNLAMGSAKGYKWVVREPDTGRVLKEVAADTAQCFYVGTKPKGLDENRSGENPPELLRLINEHRKANGKGPLSVDSKLTKAARDHTDWMASPSGKFSHTGKDGSSADARIKAAGAVFKVSGENIAKDYKFPQQVFDGWKNSDGHNKNMLGASYSKVGIAYKGYYWTVVFTN
jgi:uncharacterized protein YkwD